MGAHRFSSAVWDIVNKGKEVEDDGHDIIHMSEAGDTEESFQDRGS